MLKKGEQMRGARGKSEEGERGVQTQVWGWLTQWNYARESVVHGQGSTDRGTGQRDRTEGHTGGAARRGQGGKGRGRAQRGRPPLKRKKNNLLTGGGRGELT